MIVRLSTNLGGFKRPSFYLGGGFDLNSWAIAVLVANPTFAVTLSNVSFIFNVNRIRFEHSKITGGGLDPAFYVYPSRFGWLNNRIRFRHHKIS